ncbi:uncharacterized protein [Drosophila suzukii]|uniref:Uncharacterized protein isoform X1 n=1 Tax=Drosophila suzukii TaxID=28584 RepID=A0AB39ZC63_DROSZ
MENLAVCLAAFFQLMGCYFFFAQPEDRCSQAPDLASWIFLVATMCFLWDTSIYPRRFMHMARFWRILIEIVAGIFLAEVGTIIIWCGLERFLYSLTDLLLNLTHNGCQSSPYGYWLSGLITSLVALAVLWYVLEATDGMYYLMKFARELGTTTMDTWGMLSCYINMNNRDRRRALKVCQLARKTPNRRSSSRRCCQPDGDSCD